MDLVGFMADARDLGPEGWVRRALLVVAVVEFVIALASLVLASGDHAAREVAGLEMALAAGLFTVALHPVRARALAPVLVTAAAVVAWSMVVDFAGGNASSLIEAHHTLELAGTALVVGLARRCPGAFGSGPMTRM